LGSPHAWTTAAAVGVIEVIQSPPDMTFTCGFVLSPETVNRLPRGASEERCGGLAALRRSGGELVLCVPARRQLCRSLPRSASISQQGVHWHQNRKRSFSQAKSRYHHRRRFLVENGIGVFFSPLSGLMVPQLSMVGARGRTKRRRDVPGPSDCGCLSAAPIKCNIGWSLDNFYHTNGCSGGPSVRRAQAVRAATSGQRA